MALLKVDIVGREARYSTEDLEAGLVFHAHMPLSGEEHDTRCVEGTICVYLWPYECHTLKSGDHLVYDSTRWHGVYPLKVPATWINTLAKEQAEYHDQIEQNHRAPSWARV